MSTTQSAKPHERTKESKPSKTKEFNIEALTPEMLQEVASLLKPLQKFNKAAEMAGMDDVTFYWDVEVIRGKDTVFAHLNGSSTLHSMLAPNAIIEATYRAEQEITDKILRPIVGAFQDYVNRVALEQLPAKEEEPGFEDLMDDDQ